MSLVLDRISSLPDEVICHILSFIPIKDTVATSLLSKRWYPLWRSVSVIDLTDEYYARNWKIYPKFHHFLFSLLLFRDATQPIKRFTLKCLFEDPDHKIINACVTSVLQCGVEYLKLEMRNVPFLCKLPIGILSCKTLVFLNLFGFCVRQVSSVDLPLVKTLHLERVGFKGKCSLLQLLSGCPNLEDFKAIDVESTFGDILEKFKSLTKLIRAEIHVNGSIKLPLEVLYNVEYLSLIMEKEPPGYNNVPTFYNLARMKLLFREEYRWQWLVEVLDHCPKLRILDVNNEFSYETQIYQDDNLVSPKVVPESVSLHLRKCTVRNYEGKKGELHLVRYLMQNASVLQTMRIYYKSGVKFCHEAQNEGRIIIVQKALSNMSTLFLLMVH